MTVPSTNEYKPIVFANERDHGAPWSFVAKEVFFEEEDGGQGSHSRTQVALMNVWERETGENLEVILGDERNVDALINALKVVKARMKVQERVIHLESAQSELRYQEKQAAGELL